MFWKLAECAFVFVLSLTLSPPNAFQSNARTPAAHSLLTFLDSQLDNNGFSSDDILNLDIDNIVSQITDMDTTVDLSNINMAELMGSLEKPY